jgi:hypothetical protein
VKSVAQSAMHCAVRLAVQLVCAVMDARSSHAIFASTPQVALHEAEHLSSHVSAPTLVQLEAQESAHVPPQRFWHWSTSKALAHTPRQSSSHWVRHVALQLELAWASQVARQLDPHAIRQLPVAAALHVVSAVPPMSAWHCVAVSIRAHVNGH